MLHENLFNCWKPLKGTYHKEVCKDKLEGSKKLCYNAPFNQGVAMGNQHLRFLSSLSEATVGGKDETN